MQETHNNCFESKKCSTHFFDSKQLLQVSCILWCYFFKVLVNHSSKCHFLVLHCILDNLWTCSKEVQNFLLQGFKYYLNLLQSIIQVDANQLVAKHPFLLPWQHKNRMLVRKGLRA